MMEFILGRIENVKLGLQPIIFYIGSIQANLEINLGDDGPTKN